MVVASLTEVVGWWSRHQQRWWGGRIVDLEVVGWQVCVVVVEDEESEDEGLTENSEVCMCACVCVHDYISKLNH